MTVTAIVLLIINLNTASVQQLQSLPCIGHALARRIVEFREKNHGFKRVEELLAVPGISEKRWRAIRDKVEVTPVGEPASGQQWPQKGPKDTKRFSVLFVPFCG